MEEEASQIYEQYHTTTVVTSVLYVLTIIIGGLGNSGVIFLYAKDKTIQKNAYHYLITNLAAADFVMSACFTPLLFIYRVNASAKTAEKTPICEMILLFSMTGISMQYFIFTLLAKNRREVVMNRGDEPTGSISQTKRIVTVLWLISIVSGIVMVGLARNALASGDGIPKLYRCLIMNQSLDTYTLFFLGYSFSLFVIAFVVAVYMYGKVYCAYKMQVVGMNASLDEKDRCKLTAALMVLYVLLWTPFLLVQLQGIFGTYTEMTTCMASLQHVVSWHQLSPSFCTINLTDITTTRSKRSLSLIKPSKVAATWSLRMTVHLQRGWTILSIRGYYM